MGQPPNGPETDGPPMRSRVEELALALQAAGELVAGIRPEQWSAPTPCRDWDVRRLVEHLIGMNLVFTAMLSNQPPPQRGGDVLGDDPTVAYQESASALLAAFAQPAVLDTVFQGPLGSATGAERLQIRLYDLLAHVWDLGQATGQPVQVPDDLADQALAFVRRQLPAQARGDRFGPAQAVSGDAPAIDRLVAFLGRPLPSEQ